MFNMFHYSNDKRDRTNTSCFRSILARLIEIAPSVPSIVSMKIVADVSGARRKSLLHLHHEQGLTISQKEDAMAMIE